MTDPHPGPPPERRLTALSWRASLATTLTLLVALAAVVDFVVTLELRAFFDDLESGTLHGAEARERAGDLDDLDLALRIAMAVMLVLAGVAWMVWLWAARRNAARLDTWPLRRSQGWVIAGWLVPIVNLWFPKQIVDDTWLATEHFLAPPDAPCPRRPLLVYAWWITFLACWMTGRAVDRMPTDTLDDLRRLATYEQIYDGLIVVSAVLGVAVIGHITRRQQAARELSATAVGSPA